MKMMQMVQKLFSIGTRVYYVGNLVEDEDGADVDDVDGAEIIFHRN